MTLLMRGLVVALMMLPTSGGAAQAAAYGRFRELAASPLRNAARPARKAGLREAMLLREPRLRRLVPVAGRVMRAHGSAVEAAARRCGVSPPLLLALVVVEPGGDAQAVGPRVPTGLGQLVPATAARFGVADPFEPQADLRTASRHPDWLLDRFGQDAVLALAACNAGEGAVDRRGGVPACPETRAHVPASPGLGPPLPAGARACRAIPATAARCGEVGLWSRKGADRQAGKLTGRYLCVSARVAPSL